MSECGGSNPVGADEPRGKLSPATCATPHLRLHMLSNPLYLSGVREMVSSVARRLGFSDQQCSQIALALDEALCNVMRHGYGRRLDGPIWVNVWPLVGGASSTAEPGALLNGTAPEIVDGLKLVIEDEAEQVDPSVIKSRDLDDIRPGGLGVHIIKEVMDQVVYEKRADCTAAGRSGIGMRLTMVKKKVAPDKGAGPVGGCGSCCP